MHEANIQDYRGGKRLLAPLIEVFPRLKLIWADSGYKKEGFDEWVKATLGWDVEFVEHPWSGLRGVWAPKDAVIDWEKIRPSGFHVLPHRWIVEKTQSQDPCDTSVDNTHANPYAWYQWTAAVAHLG